MRWAESLGEPDGALRSAFDRSPHGMTVSDLDGHWLRVNDAYCRLVGRDRAELIDRDRDATHPDDVLADRQFVAAALAGQTDRLQRNKRYVGRDGSIRWARVHAEVVRGPAGEPLYFVAHLQALDAPPVAQGARSDNERILRSVIDNTPAIVCVKGRDHRYKLVNLEFEKYFGVSSEWIVGRSDAEILAPSQIADARAKDRLVFDGGQSPPEEEATIRDGQPVVMLNTRFAVRDDSGAIDGVCLTSIDITDRRLEERSKRERLETSKLICSALAQDRLVLYGQPIVHLASMGPGKVELLVRMRAEREGEEMLAPGAFLPAAERFDLITLIDEWVVDRAIELAAAGHRVTVNVSAKTISEARQLARIEQAVIASRAPTENLIFEITETAVADNLGAARTFAIHMGRLGCAIALDDFGVGHGSFTYLRHLPIDYLKIDMQFVRELLGSEEDRQVVTAIIGVAQQFGITTIAEGVEDEATLEELRRLGVDYAQGYWLGRPSPLEQCWPSPDANGLAVRRDR